MPFTWGSGVVGWGGLDWKVISWAFAHVRRLTLVVGGEGDVLVRHLDTY